MRIREIIIESYPLAKKEFSQVADPAVVQTTIDQYRELVRKNQFRNPEEKNINHWRRLGWEAFSQMIKVKSNDVTDTQRKRGKVVGNAITLQDDSEWTVLIPLDKEASVHYGKYTEWCTTKPYQSYFEDYVYKREITLIYAIDNTKSGRSVAISIEPTSKKGNKIKMFDQNDRPIDATIYKEISGLDSSEFIKMALSPGIATQIADNRTKYKEAIDQTKLLLKTKPLDHEAIERVLKFTKNGKDCCNYIIKYNKLQKGRINVHPIILISAVSSLETGSLSQSTWIDIGRYIDFSKISIATFKSLLRVSPRLFRSSFDLLNTEQKSLFTTMPGAAYFYANTILDNTPFPAGEAAIATDGEYSYRYAYDVLKKTRFPAGEAAIATDAIRSCFYATEILGNTPFPAGEPAILSNRDCTITYTNNVLKKHRSVSWEQLIKDDPQASFEYATTVFKNPFPAGEAAIATDDYWRLMYTKYVLTTHNSPTWENLIKNDPTKSLEYAKVLKQIFPAGEAAIATDPAHAAEYDNMFGTNLSQQ